MAGDPEYLRDWAPYVIANPTPLEHKGRVYDSFIITPYDGANIFKKEDDGPFYAIVSAYAFWKLLDDDTQLMQWYGTLRDSMDFLESHSYKPKVGLYAEYLINEAPLKGSPYWKDEQREDMKIEGDWPMYIQSAYLNVLMYASNLMMSEIAMELGKPDDSKRYFGRADDLARKVDELLWQEDKGIYLAGLATMEDGRVVDVPWNYYNIFFDYIWAFSLYPMTPNSQRSLASLDDCVEKFTHDDVCSFWFSPAFGHSAAVYGWSGRYDKARRLSDQLAGLRQAVEWNDKMQALYAMKGAMPEVPTIAKFHRPQTFSAAPMLHGIVSLGVSLDFNGINVVPSGNLDKVEGIHFKNAIYDIDLNHVGAIGGLTLDGQTVPYTLRIPSSFHTPGRHKVALLDVPKADSSPLLLHTTLELVSVEKNAKGAVVYRVNGYGHGTMRFANRKGMTPRIINAVSQAVPFEQWSDNTGTYLQVRVSGRILDVIWD